MRAIAGIFQRSEEPIATPTLDRLAQALGDRHAGRIQTWHAGPLGLVQAIGSTTAQAGIVATARLDNRAELAERLGSAAHSDAELIRAAYAQWGPDCTKHLLGDFAFALWDADTQQLFCARDQFGVRPFFYYLADDRFAFASDLRTLLSIAGVPCRLNQERARSYLSGNSLDAEQTFYADMRRLPAAHTLWISARATAETRYWSLDAQRELRFGSDDEYAAGFQAIFREAVLCRLETSEPVGAFLSGGLDSSAIVGMAQDLGYADLPVISAQFPTVAACDEGPYIAAVTARGRHVAQVIRGDASAPWSTAIPWWKHLAEPHNGMGMGLCWGLLAAAQTQGLGVVLDGNGGDEVVSQGDDYLLQLLYTRRYRHLLAEVQASSRQGSDSFAALLWQLGVHATLLPALRNLSRRLRGKALRGQVGARALHRQAIGATQQALSMDVFAQAGAAWGIELRFPFWDRRLVEYCLALPPEQKRRNGLGRYVLRNAMQGLMPERVRQRGDKADFMPNLLHGIRSYERERLSELLHAWDVSDDEQQAAHLRRIAHKLLHRQGRVAPHEIGLLWRAITYALWFRQSGLSGTAGTYHQAQQATNTALGWGRSTQTH